MTKTLIDIDEDLLKQAGQILEANTKKATINGALREIVRRHAAEAFLSRAQSGLFDNPAHNRRDTP